MTPAAFFDGVWDAIMDQHLYALIDNMKRRCRYGLLVWARTEQPDRVLPLAVVVKVASGRCLAHNLVPSSPPAYSGLLFAIQDMFIAVSSEFSSSRAKD